MYSLLHTMVTPKMLTANILKTLMSLLIVEDEPILPTTQAPASPPIQKPRYPSLYENHGAKAPYIGY